MKKKAFNFSPFKRKPNWTACILVILVVAILYCYFGNDLKVFNQAMEDRARLSQQVANAILYDAEIDIEKIQKDMDQINEQIQSLRNSTDLGEYIAANDVTAEGRQENENVITLIWAIVAVFATYLEVNFIRIFWCLVIRGKKKGRFQREEVESESETESGE